MKIDGQSHRTIFLKEGDSRVVQIIDQRLLPHRFEIVDLAEVDDFVRAIRDMQVRGAPLIGATAAFGMYIACLHSAGSHNWKEQIQRAAERLRATRPTAVDLFHAVGRSLKAISELEQEESRIEAARKIAEEVAEESVTACKQIGNHGLELIRKISEEKGGDPVHVLTHCNAGWLACIDYGTATAPIYAAHHEGIDLHVWVDETRPRNQGSRLTAFELLQEEVPHTIIADNAGGHLMQHGKVDLVIVGSDRTTRRGDVANKIGTYLKALAARENEVPFYVALPSSSIDWEIADGLSDIPIEERGSEEIKYMEGWNGMDISRVLIAPAESPALNYGFDVTPARFVTGLITERGVCEASEEGLSELFPEQAALQGETPD